MAEPDPAFDPLAVSDYLSANGYSLAPHRNSMFELALRIASIFVVIFLMVEIIIVFRSNKKTIK